MDNRSALLNEYHSLLIGDRTVGYVGVGGSLGFADPGWDLALGYTMNRCGLASC